MVLHLLNPGDRVRLPACPLLVRLEVGHARPPRLAVVGPEGSALAAPRALSRPGGLLLPRLTATATVELWPPDGLTMFEAASIITVSVGPDGDDPEADQVRLTFDVSGLPRADLAVLTPQGHEIEVTGRGSRGEPPLPPTAQAARDVARELLGLAYVSGEHAVDIVVGLDCSPSMRPWVQGGVAETVLEVFAGLASVLDPNGHIDAVLCGRSATNLKPAGIDVFATEVTTEARRHPLTTGLRSRLLAASTPETLTYLVTDGIPPDFERQTGSPHLVVVQEALPGRSVQPKADRWMTTLPVAEPAATGGGWSRDRMRPVVASLLTAYTDRDAGSPRRERGPA